MFILDSAYVLSRPEVRALLGFAGSDSAKPHLAAVLFTPDGRAVSADGQRLALLSLRTPSKLANVRSGLVPRACLDLAAKACPMKGSITVDVGASLVSVYATDDVDTDVLASFPIPKAAAKLPFPEWEKAIPDISDPARELAPAIEVSAQFLGDLVLVAAASDTGAPRAILLHSPTSCESGLVVTVGMHWKLVLMPMRSHNADKLARARGSNLEC